MARRGRSSHLTREDVLASYYKELTIVGGMPIRTHGGRVTDRLWTISDLVGFWRLPR
jgi:hypothetical protein